MELEQELADLEKFYQQRKKEIEDKKKKIEAESKKIEVEKKETGKKIADDKERLKSLEREKESSKKLGEDLALRRDIYQVELAVKKLEEKNKKLEEEIKQGDKLKEYTKSEKEKKRKVKRDKEYKKNQEELKKARKKLELKLENQKKLAKTRKERKKEIRKIKKAIKKETEYKKYLEEHSIVLEKTKEQILKEIEIEKKDRKKYSIEILNLSKQKYLQRHKTLTKLVKKNVAGLLIETLKYKRKEKEIEKAKVIRNESKTVYSIDEGEALFEEAMNAYKDKTFSYYGNQDKLFYENVLFKVTPLKEHEIKSLIEIDKDYNAVTRFYNDKKTVDLFLRNINQNIEKLEKYRKKHKYVNIYLKFITDNLKEYKFYVLQGTYEKWYAEVGTTNTIQEVKIFNLVLYRNNENITDIDLIYIYDALKEHGYAGADNFIQNIEINTKFLLPDKNIPPQDISSFQDIPMKQYHLCYSGFLEIYDDESKDEFEKLESECVYDILIWYNKKGAQISRSLKSDKFMKMKENWKKNGCTNDEWKKIREEYDIPGTHYVVNNGNLQEHHKITPELNENGKMKHKNRRILNTVNVNGHMYVTEEMIKEYIDSNNINVNDKDINNSQSTFYESLKLKKKIPIYNEIINPDYEVVVNAKKQNFIFTNPRDIENIYMKLLNNNIICSSNKFKLGPVLNDDNDISNFRYKTNTCKLINTETEISIKILEDMNVNQYFSCLSDKTQKIFDELKITSICYSKGTDENMITIDDSKHYTRSLYEIEDLYICNHLCEFEPSDLLNPRIDKGFYIIETDNLYYFPSGNGIYCDYNITDALQNGLKHQLDFKIMAYMKPVRIIKNPFIKVIDDLCNSSNTMDENKNIINKITGLLERTKISNRYKFYSDNYLNTFNFRHNGYFTNIQQEGKFWTTIKYVEKNIKWTGFLIKQQIYCMSYILFNRMLNNISASLNYKIKFQDIRRRWVDSVTLTLNHDLENLKKMLESTCVVIGLHIFPQHKIEKTKVTRMTHEFKNRPISWIYVPHIPEIYEFETMGDHIFHILDSGLILIDGRAACGKTITIKKYLKNQEIKYKIIVPQNTMRINFLEPGGKSEAITIQTFLGKYKWEYVDILYIDEIYKINELEAQLIIEYIEKFPKTRIIATGSSKQLKGLNFSNDGKISSFSFHEFPGLLNKFNKKINITSGFNKEMLKKTDLIKDNRILNARLFEYKMINGFDELIGDSHYICRSNDLKNKINEFFFRIEQSEYIKVRPKENTKKFIKYEPCLTKKNNYKKSKIEIENQIFRDSEIIKEEIKREKIELDYCSTINLSQSLRIDNYGIVLYKNQLNDLTKEEIEVAFTRNPGHVVYILN